jgi:Zn-dependent peptidase ImmA (M78 family)/DNA-binding XRE family transcriptional regulator
MARTEANPTPSVLAWARESAGFSIESVAKKVGITAERLTAWEAGRQRPTYAQLRKLGTVYKRPLAAFYLAEPPYRFEAMHDFRRPAEAPNAPQSPELTFEIRRARDRREWALELFSDLEEEAPQLTAAIDMRQDTEHSARQVRELLGVTLEQQSTWRTDYEAFKRWRLLIERVGILTFQANNVDVAEVRGFSIAERPMPAAVANIKDAPRGRIFTLLHEVIHILLSDGGICDLHDLGADAASQAENYCNRVAGAILFPRGAVMTSDTVKRHRKGDVEWSDLELGELSRQFGGSPEAALVRLLTLGLTTERFYRVRRDVFVAQYAEQRKRQKEGFAPPHEVALTSAGPKFTSLVVESFNRELITASDVSDYLQVRLKHLSDIQREYARLST